MLTAEQMVGWLRARIEIVDADAKAHPDGSSNRRFYEAQVIAYENALSVLLGIEGRHR
jgi:hypothetical protein